MSDWKGSLSRVDAIRIFEKATDHDDPYWDYLVEDWYNEDSDTMPSMYHVLAAIGVTEDEYREIHPGANINWPQQQEAQESTAIGDAVLYGTGFHQNGQRVDPRDVYRHPAQPQETATMSDLPRRLRASLKFDAINGDRSERSVCGLQMAEAARTIEDLEARLAAAEADAGRHQDVLQKIQSWCEAYPLDVFPEPDWSEVKDKLGAKLLSRVSASNMRHVVLGVKKLCDDAALQATAQEADNGK